ncbi:MAG: LD-carboxypeptidase [Saprospiraceae bacterium]|jgi:muramoyltetrapeptide carboxypeptidase|nr:LD-carboxypeptidase [Saprospiraceae bacterium]
MHRRQFNRHLMVGALASLAGTPVETQNFASLRKPARLKTGDLVGLITPGSYISDESLQKAVQNIENMGFRVKLSPHIREQRGFIAGEDRQRLDDLHGMFADKEVAAVWCARGGYGCSRLLPAIDYKLIAQNPKVLIGYSDVTALLQAVFLQTGLVGFHGPVAASDFTDYTKAQLTAVLIEGKAGHLIAPAEGNLAELNPAYQPFLISPGIAGGPLMGGNLSLLAALAGTPYQADVAGKLLFIEEVGEKPYRIDRMLTQLRQAWPLHRAAGIVLGIFEDCEPKADDLSLSLPDTLKDRLGDLGIPVAYGFSFGHISHQCTLPLGIQATMDTQHLTITLAEPAVA